MEQLMLDFNSRNERDEVRIGPAALERLRIVRDGRMHAGDCVLVVDADGNRCSGILMFDPSRRPGHEYSVALDWNTWVDGDDAGAPAYDPRLVAAG